MTSKEIEKYKHELCEIHTIDNLNKQGDQLAILAMKLNAPIAERHPDYPLDFINKITRNIHTSLQTEMMLNACVSAEQSTTFAKWSCFWAAVAAIAACISVVLVLFCG